LAGGAEEVFFKGVIIWSLFFNAQLKERYPKDSGKMIYWDQEDLLSFSFYKNSGRSKKKNKWGRWLELERL